MIFRSFPDQGFLWKRYRNPEFPESPSPSRFQDFGVPIFGALGGNEVDILGHAERRAIVEDVGTI